ncbi:uncharacterized protein EV420DRAFT_1764588 [Desarmillaria tabescens]|uniref:Heterokaryon incompatibility domain-containing protein n=1 Tax=Armillaria tabescens TaxID=1929756 RepID=A0AA39KBI9_ARMTA|nr:uncharacterized protein EV420DRAFT_1764588 [Desarmillaria tabescens]KAK0458122.1 hypothetical protein EV420DRAFT_1764588 [Desarmillaria tabescens]
MSIQNDIYSVFATAQAIKGPSPDESSGLDENTNTTMPSEPREERGHSISEDVGPVLEATPDSSPHYPELPSDMDLQTSPKEEQSSDTSDDDSDASSASESDIVRPWLQPEHISLPAVAISAFTEMGQEESSITVPLQQVYTGRKPVISSRVADTPCATLGVQGLLDLLNTTLGTSYGLGTQSLSSLLEECITKKYDVGMAYSRLRRIWYTDNWSTIRDQVWEWKEQDREMRRRALVGNRIVQPYLDPRRVWDLYSNRVVPWWFTGMCWGMRGRVRAISHAWMDEKDRVAVWTPINGHEWPVPIPKDADLNLVGGRGEDMRPEEWKLDVPTIGSVYWGNRVVIYLSELGRPLTLKEGDLDSDRSWFRRAWTLQEVGYYNRLIGGDTPDGPMHVEPIDEDGNYETKLLTRFHRQLKSTHRMSTFETLESMQNRVSTNPVDKVAGLAFRLNPDWIPAYYEDEYLEDAWTALVNSMDVLVRGQLFLGCPEPGNAGTKWRSSWDQIMTKPLSEGVYTQIEVVWDEEMNEDWCDVEYIEKGLVAGIGCCGRGLSTWRIDC